MEKCHAGIDQVSCSCCEKKDSRLKNLTENLWYKYTTIIISAVILLFSVLNVFGKEVSLFLILVSYIIVGWNVILSALKNIIKGKVFDENFLMSIATVGALILGEFHEAVGVMLFYQIGELFQDRAVARSKKAITQLMDIRPDTANLVKNDGVISVHPSTVAKGDTILIKTGERVPLDGVVTDGSCSLDTSALTGESIPREIKIGDDILAGTINLNGVITVEVRNRFEESAVSKILLAVEHASEKKAVAETFIRKFAKIYTPVVVILAAVIAFVPALLGYNTFYHWINTALIFLVVSCPCALVISIPLSYFVGLGKASQNGVLIKGSNYLDALNHVSKMVFDKTGTLTTGRFTVMDIVTNEGSDEEEVVRMAAIAEKHSNHPIARSILNKYENIEYLPNPEMIQEFSGFGVKAIFEGKIILTGSRRFLEEQGVSIAFEDMNKAGTLVFVAVDDRWMGTIRISDELKSDAASTIKGLKKLNINEIFMFTGDIKENTEMIGQKLEIDTVYAELLPHEKLEYYEKIENDKLTAFVGDGINDAPVLARADIGIAMGGAGSDATLEAADIILMTDEPGKIVTAFSIAKKTRRITMGNIIFALFIKISIMGFALAGLANMWSAVFADVGVTILAILNSIRLLYTGREK